MAKCLYRGSPCNGLNVVAECLTVPYCVSMTIKLHFEAMDTTERISNFCNDLIYQIKVCGVWDKFITDYEIPLSQMYSKRTRQMKIDITSTFKPHPKTYMEAKEVFSTFLPNLVKWCLELSATHGIQMIHQVKNPPKQVAQYTKSGELIAVWANASQAQEGTGVGSGSILANANGTTSSAGGYVWKFI